MIFTSKKALFFAIVGVLLQSCTGQAGHVADEVKKDVFSDFNKYPDTSFVGIFLGQSMDEAKSVLKEKMFICTDSSGSYQFERMEDSTTVVLIGISIIEEIKVFLKSKNQITKKDELVNKFQPVNCETQRRNDELLFISCTRSGKVFKTSIFSQPDYLRITFK